MTIQRPRRIQTTGAVEATIIAANARQFVPIAFDIETDFFLEIFRFCSEISSHPLPISMKCIQSCINLSHISLTKERVLHIAIHKEEL